MESITGTVDYLSICYENIKHVRNCHENIKIKTVNGKNYREYCRLNNWKQTCCINERDKKLECYNFQIKNTSYCKKHENGVQNTKISTTDKGGLVENHSCELLQQCHNITNIINIGYERCSLDVIFQVKNEINNGLFHMRGIQVKTLIEKTSNSFFVNNINIYDNNTIIIAINLEYNYYCIFNNSMIESNTFSYNPNDQNHRYREFCFHGLNLKNSNGYTFLDLLNYYCVGSTLYSALCFNGKNLKEKLMIDALKIKCQEWELKLEPYSTSDSSIDCVVNDILNCQLKFSTSTITNTYHFSLHKTLNMFTVPYAESDNIHIFVFSYINSDEEYIFYVIPIKVLIHYGFISTSLIYGKTSITISSSDSQNDNWTKNFVNRFDLFTDEFNMDELINLDDMFDKFQYECKKKDIICIRDMNKLNSRYFNIGSKICKYCESTTPHGNCYRFTIENGLGLTYNSDTDIIPDFFIFRIKFYPDYFWIIPKQRLIDEGIIGSNLVKGIIKYNFPILGNKNKNKKWLDVYLNNYNLLKQINTASSGSL